MEYTKEQIDKIYEQVLRKEITICEMCDEIFDYVPRKILCDKCRVDPEYRAKERQRDEVKKKKREYMREYYQRPEVKARVSEYRQRPEVKEQQREYRQRPEVKERKRKYKQNPEYKAKEREYYQRPEVKERQREYEQRPEVKERRREYSRRKREERKNATG